MMMGHGKGKTTGRWFGRVVAGAALVVLALAGDAAARDFSHYTCRPERDPVTGHSFDYYMLSLSWSPNFCSSGGADSSPDQCRIGRDLGFVVHGLWPQTFETDDPYDQPRGCAVPFGPPTEPDYAAAAKVFPDAAMLCHEYGKHGTCSGLSPSAYLKVVEKAARGIVVPAAYRRPTRAIRTDTATIAADFTRENHYPRGAVLASRLGGGGVEVRICLDKASLAAVPCPDGVARQRSYQRRQVTLQVPH